MPKCERHTDEKLRREIEYFIKTRHLNPADYFSATDFTTLTGNEPEFELSLP
jgi:hypothetical protein